MSVENTIKEIKERLEEIKEELETAEDSLSDIENDLHFGYNDDEEREEIEDECFHLEYEIAALYREKRILKQSLEFLGEYVGE